MGKGGGKLIAGMYTDRFKPPGCLVAAVLFIFFFLPPDVVASGGEDCVAPLARGDVQEVCDALAMSREAELGREAALRERRLAERLSVGLYRTLERDRQCYRLAGTQVRTYVEKEQAVLVDRFKSSGDTSDTSHVQVLSCQVRRDQGESGRFVDVSVQLFWTSAEPDRLGVTAERRRLGVGEFTGVQARLQCGPCPVQHKRLVFRAGPGGTISPAESTTDGQGIARTVFTLRREQIVTVSAQHRSRKAKIVIEPRWRPWKVRVHATYRGNAEEYQGSADFRTEFSGVLLGKIISQARALLSSGDLSGYPLKFFQVHAPMDTTGILQGWEKHLSGKRWEKKVFNQETTASLLIGLIFHDGRPDRENLYLLLPIKPILLYTGPAGPYFFFFYQGNCSPDKTVVTDAVIPLNRPLPDQSFSLESVVLSSGESCGEWRTSYTFVPQQDRGR